MIKVMLPVDLFFIRTEIEECSVMLMRSKANSLTSGNKEIRSSEFADAVGSMLVNSATVSTLVNLISVISC